MIPRLRRITAVFVFLFLIAGIASASAYNGQPKLIVLITVDQLRADLLERYRDQFSADGFRLLMDRGANFTNCFYQYADTKTAPGMSTLATGAYTNGHGIIGDEWYDPVRKKMVTSVEDPSTRILGVETNAAGASPHNLLATTIADELKLATQGKSRVFAVSFKDRSAILPSGHTTDVAFWIDKASGLWVTSTYYRSEMPAWAAAFNNAGHAKSYLNRQWKDAAGNVLRTTNPGQTWPDGTPLDFYETVGRTPFANDYTLEFTRELIVNEKLGTGPAPDYLSLSISSQDILGHRVGPDSPQIHALLLALDRQLAEFFAFLGKQVGLANVWIALSADHGVSPLADVSTKLHIPGGKRDISTLKDDVNAALSAKFSPGKNTEFLVGREFPNFFISEEAFRTAGVQENDAERAVGDALMARLPELRGYFTRYQMRNGGLPQNELGKMMAHSYSDHGGWYVIVQPKPYWVTMTSKKYDPGTDHGLPYNYDQHVPLLLYGVPFVPGTYRGRSEPVDLAPTWASLLGINPPSSSIGRVLTEALRAAGGSQ